MSGSCLGWSLTTGLVDAVEGVPVRGRSSAGERLLCKQGVVGSNPIASMEKGQNSTWVAAMPRPGGCFRKAPFLRPWPLGRSVLFEMVNLIW